MCIGERGEGGSVPAEGTRRPRRWGGGGTEAAETAVVVMGGVTGYGDGNPAELPECGRLQRR